LDPLALGATIVGALGILSALFIAARRLAGGIRRVSHFFDDWFGEEDRPGVKGRAGVMDRIASIEHELRPNSGQSLRDRVDLIEKHVRPET
jgi:hypothetical protein